jgi:hypothetical protein
MGGLVAVVTLAGVIAGGPGGCATPRQSTSLSVDDIEETARELAAKLSGSDLLLGRNAESPKMVIAIQKVQNLSTDLIPEPQQWYIMAKIRDSQSIMALRRLRNVAFVIPAEHLRGTGMDRETDQDLGAGRRPTHEMTATFRSATRASGRNRTDVYLCECRVTSLETGELAWTDTVEFKKSAFGKAYD